MSPGSALAAATTSDGSSSLALQLGVVLFLVLVNAALAGTEMAMVSLRPAQLHRLEKHSAAGVRLATLARDPNRYLSTIQVGITLAGFLASASAAVTLAEPLRTALAGLGAVGDVGAVVLVTVALSYVTLVLGELAPKRIAMRRAERWALVAARPLAFLSRLARPVVWVLGVSTNFVVRLAGVDPREPREQVSTEELQVMVATAGTLSVQQRRVIAGAFDVAERRLRDVLVPRPQAFVLDSEQEAPEALRELVASGHSRAPVAPGRDLDRVSGTVHLRDLVDSAGRLVGEVAAPPVLFPEGARALGVLSELQRRHVQQAIVIDEHGGAVGLVTVEDLVEEIVGEIYDETDAETLQVVTEPGGSILVPGHFAVHDLVDLDVQDVPATGAYATVAGLILDRLGRMPTAPGERVVVSGHEFEVAELSARAIERVRIRPRRAQPPLEEE